MSKNVRIESINGVPDLLIDGELHSRMVGREFGRMDLETECLRHLKETRGIRLYMVKSPLKNTTGWDGRDGYDYRPFEMMIDKYLEVNPDLLLILHVGILTRAPWKWMEDHEDQLMAFGKDLRWAWPSFGSDIWFEDFTRACARFVEHFETGPYADKIAGYVPVHMSHEWGGHNAVCCEGRWGDVSPAMRETFRSWLRSAYRQDVGALRAAWNDPDVDFDTAEVPSQAAHEDWQNGPRIVVKSECFGTRVPDCRLCCTERAEDLVVRVCTAMKDACGGSKLIGVMADIVKYSARVSACPAIDFFHKPQAYHNRNFGTGNFQPQHSLGSVHAHGKMMIQQSDLNTHQLPDLINKNIDPPTHERNTRNEWQTLQTMTRDVAACLQHQCGFYWVDGGPGQFWNWEREGFGIAHYHKLWFDSPSMHRHIGRLQKLIDEVQRRRPAPCADVALIRGIRGSSFYISDPEAQKSAFASVMNHVLRHWTLPDTGTPFDEYILEDWELIPRAYKVYLFPDAVAVCPGLREKIRAKLAREGATAVWQYAPGYISDGVMDLAHMEALTGMRHQVSYERDFLQVELAGSHSLLENVDVRSYGSDLDYRVYARECNWFQWPNQPEDYRFDPRFSVNDPDAETLGRFRNSGEVGLAVKETSGFRSVYTGAPCIPAGLLRKMFREAGVHLYADQGNLVYANDGMVAVRFRRDGVHRIRLPRAATAVDALDSEVVAEHADCFEVKARYGECRVFWLE